MADRQTPEGVVVELPPEQLLHYLRVINFLSPDKAKVIATAAEESLTRLGMKRDASKARTEVYGGALDVDLGTMLAWMKRVRSNHTRAKKQLQVLDASACVRAGLV